MRAPDSRAAPVAPLHLDSLARFVDRLPIPGVLTAAGVRPDPLHPNRLIPFYRVAMREIRVPVHRDLPPTRWWSYGETVPGPTIEVARDRPILVEWRNELPPRHFLPIDHTLCGAGPGVPEVRAIVHVHGGRVPPESDGYPEDWYPPGGSALCRYPNQQDAATLWYHDHAMGIERLNQYAGLFGLYLVRDPGERALGLPRGAQEIPLVLCDRLFDRDGQLRYPVSGDGDAPWVCEVVGDAVLVNEKLFPYVEVEPRAYRIRVVNASNGRIFYLGLSNGSSCHQIATDQGLLPKPVALETLTLAPAERAELIVDFRAAAGENVILHSQSIELMQFRVADGPPAARSRLPARLREVRAIPLAAAGKSRTLTLNEYTDPKNGRMLMLLNGSRWHDPITETVELSSVEIWNLVNLTEDVHPIHLHLVRFQILERQPFDADEYLTSGNLHAAGKAVAPGDDEAGWKDTVRADPGMITRIIVRFDGYVGRYVWHCHLLEHAANEMMRPYRIVASNASPSAARLDD